MKDEFSRFHPLVNLIFYLVVLGLTMFQMQLGLVLISIFSALAYYFCLKGREGVKYLLIVSFVFFVSSFINPLFSHRGGTLLFYLFTGNPVTLESIIYGIVSSAGPFLIISKSSGENITTLKTPNNSLAFFIGIPLIAIPFVLFLLR